MAEFSLSTATELFKIKYGKLSENTYNSANVTLARTKKDYTFTGRQYFVPVPLSFSGGVGSGSLPTANVNNVDDATLTAKKVYAVVQIEREAIKASTNDEGSFVRATRWVVQRGVESYMRNASRILWNDGTGHVAEGDGATNVSGTGTTGDPYVVRLATTQKEADVEERDFWNYDAETTNLEVQSYDPSTRDVSLVGTSAGLAALTGVGPVPAATYFSMQGSLNNDPLGIKGILDATTGSLYGISVARRWQASAQNNAAGAGITTDMMNNDVLEIERKCGKVPNLIITSFTQYRKILNILEDKKYFSIGPRPQDLKGHISFRGLEFMSSAGPIAIFPERFVDDDRIYYLNDNFMTIYHRPDFGWFDDDGTVFLREASQDSYSARYGGYWELYMPPTFHGVRTNLAT